MDAQNNRNSLKTLILGIIIGVVVTLITQGLLDRLKVESRITAIEIQLTTMQGQMKDVQSKVDFLYQDKRKAGK